MSRRRKKLARQAKRLSTAADGLRWIVESVTLYDDVQVKALTAAGTGWCVHAMGGEEGLWVVTHTPTGLKLCAFDVFIQAAIVCATIATTRPLPEACVQFTPNDALGLYLRSVAGTTAALSSDALIDFTHHLLTTGKLPIALHLDPDVVAELKADAPAVES